jgi:hypothetical protein
MKKSKFSEEQIAFALRMAETGTRLPVPLAGGIIFIRLGKRKREAHSAE